MRNRREKTFGPGRAVPLDGNQKARIAAYAKAWSRLHREGRQHRGPLTRAFQGVLEALLWGFHNSRTGCCFPSYQRIAEKAECCVDTVYEALKVLERAGVLTWQHRITRIQERCQDLWGRQGWRWRVVRTSNAYQFRDKMAETRGFSSNTENPGGTPNQEISMSLLAPVGAADSPLERALARLSAAIGAKKGIEDGCGPVPAS